MTQTCRLLNVSIAGVVVLTIYNVLLTFRLLNTSDCLRVNNLDESAAINSIPKAPAIISPCSDYFMSDYYQNRTEKQPFFDLDINLGRWDSKRLYKIFDFAVPGDKFVELSQKYVVCLATQSSLERLSSLVEVSNHWSGPISAAIFVAGNDEMHLLQIYVSYLRNCFSSIRERVSFHLTYPKERKPNIKTLEYKDYLNYDCAKPKETLARLMKYRTAETTKWRTKKVYPQNNLRNVARKNCQNDNVFLIDVDIIPSMNFTEHIDKFLRNEKCSTLCAYVIPTFELDTRVKFPRDKDDILRLTKKGLARPFHHKVFIYNQFATNFTRWHADENKNGEAHISHNVTNFEFLYEPFYVANDIAPPHDERFMGYGYTRNSQVYEMFVAGYQFQVLSPIFTVHWGLQTSKGRPPWRERQNDANRKVFEIFKREVFARYNKDPLKMLLPRKGQAKENSKNKSP